MIKHIVIAISFLAITACGDGDSRNGATPVTESAALKKGLFLDSAVEGLVYVSGNQSGITDNKGTYQYEEGLTVKFSIGDIIIGEALAKSVLTPLDLVPGSSDVSDPSVTNIARFLLTLDNDANPDNGITITELVRTAALGKSLNFDQTIAGFENDGNVQAIVSELTALTNAGVRPLISSQQAQSHLNETLLVRRIIFQGPQGITATGDIGLWMFKQKDLSTDAIADWIGIPYLEKTLLEPINVLWIDFDSTTEQEARDKVSSFLKSKDNDFHTEPFLHTADYYGFYRDWVSDPQWKGLYPFFPVRAAWVDAGWPGENNHGRIFPAVRIFTTSGDPAFVTSGAFSRESGVDLIDELKGHYFISFNIARNKLRKTDRWIELPRESVGNVYKWDRFRDFTTGDHDGEIRVFALYPQGENEPIPNILGEYTGSYRIDVANCSDPDMNGTYHFSINISLDKQNDNSFSGSGIGTTSDLGFPVSEHIAFSGTIDPVGVISGDTSHTFLQTGGVGTFSGKLAGDSLSIINSGQDTFGDVCTYTRNISAVRTAQR